MKVKEEKIEKLWKWFSSNEQKIRQCIETESASEQDYIVEQLNELVLDLGMFTWEIGPDTNNQWFFTISPNGDKSLLKKTRKIMESTPEIANWKFHYCKPAKQWDRILDVYDANMDIQKIDASNWNFIAIKNENKEIEITLEADNIKHLDNETANTAANLVVLNEIGEEAKMYHVGSVKIVDQIDEMHNTVKTNIESLKSIF